jgi:hypothetical protein
LKQHPKKLISSALIAGTFAMTLSTAIARDRVDSRFEPGATSTTINGTIRGKEWG